MNAEQRARLDVLIEELATLPTPELIVECCRLASTCGVNTPNIKRFEFGFSGGIAAEKLLAYLTQLRRAERMRLTIGQTIHERFTHAEKLVQSKEENDLRHAARTLMEAGYLAGEQEVQYHIWVICVGRIERFLPMASKAAGHKIPADDVNLLKSYRRLRDYYEHLEEKLPGAKNYNPETPSASDTTSGTFTFGLPMDNDGYIVMGKDRLELSSDALRRVEEVIQRNWEALPSAALDQVRRHFEQYPEHIPDPQDIVQRPLFYDGLLREMKLQAD